MTQRFYVDQDGQYLGSYDDADGEIPEEFAGAEEVSEMPKPPRPETVQRFFVDASGRYLGSFDGLDDEMPAMFAGAVEVPVAPEDANQTWIDNGWRIASLTQSALVSYAADARWRAETGGFSFAGLSIASDDRSKTMIIGARVKADGDPAFTTRWKGPDGSFATIDAATIILISDAMLQHVADCFAAEDAVSTAINAGAVTTTAQVDAMIAAAITQQQSARAPNPPSKA